MLKFCMHRSSILHKIFKINTVTFCLKKHIQGQSLFLGRGLGEIASNLDRKTLVMVRLESLENKYRYVKQSCCCSEYAE